MPIIRGGEGAAFHLKRGREFAIVNTHGSQVVDLFAHNAGDIGESLSIHHSRNVWYRLQPRQGDQLWTQLRRPILTMTETARRACMTPCFPAAMPRATSSSA